VTMADLDCTLESNRRSPPRKPSAASGYLLVTRRVDRSLTSRILGILGNLRNGVAWTEGNRLQFAIKCVDAAEGRFREFGGRRRAVLGVWRMVLWYHGRSRVVPWYCHGRKRLSGAILSMANAYTSHTKPKAEVRKQNPAPKATPRPPRGECRRQNAE
jgi:hypothetical protein